MKTTTLLILLLTIFSNCTPKVLHLKATKVSNRTKTDGQWNQFTNWDTCNIPIKIRHKIPLLSKPKIGVWDGNGVSVFKCIGSQSDTVDTLGREVILLKCKDSKGKIVMVTMTNLQQSINMVFGYGDKDVCYSVVEDIQ